MFVLKSVVGVVLIGVVVVAGYVAGAWFGLYGAHEGPGTVTAKRIPDGVLEGRTRAQANAAKALTEVQPQQILFGDLHVHGVEGVKFYTRTKVITSRWPHQDTPAPGFNMPTLG